MIKALRDLWLALLLIIGASTILLLSDLDQRNKKDKSKTEFPSIAIMQISSTPLLDNHVEGIMNRLMEKGFVAEGNSNIRHYNPQGDIAMANTIAKDIANGPADIVITSSTLALQAFAKANQNTKKIHVFGAVTDPYGTGTGISGSKPNEHPPYMAGIGTFQPVNAAFRILRSLNTKIKTVGVVWNPSEQCSEACLLEARIICNELGIKLVEAIATNTSEVSEAARSLMAKGVEAIWVGGDTVAIASLSMIINIANQEGIPVFTNDPSDSETGALFGLGANYFKVGELTADMAIEILQGRDPSTIAIENLVPEMLGFNNEVLLSLRGGWNMSQEVEARLQKQSGTVIEQKTILDFNDFASSNFLPYKASILSSNVFKNLHLKYNRPAQIALITLLENPTLEQAADGVLKGLQESGLKNLTDFNIKKFSAQGEISQLTSIMDAVQREQPDLIVTITTPAMMAAFKRIKEIPVVFTVASDPVKLKVFQSAPPANICGVHDNPPVEEVLLMAMKYDRQLKAVGIIYDAAQMNAVLSVEKLRAAGKKHQVRIEEATASTVSDLPMATQSVIQRGARAIILSADNLASTGFSSILRAASASNVPIFATEPELVARGATGAYGDSFFEWGKQSGKIAAKVLAGASPSDIGFTETAVQQRIEPKDHQKNPSKEAHFKLSIVHYSDTEFAERCHEGLIDGIEKAGYKKDRDYSLKVYNAQGDMSTLSGIMTSVKSEKPDLLMVISTPALQAALRQVGSDVKIVFTGVGDAIKAGAGKSETDHLPNVTGITTRSPFSGMARIIKETLPKTKAVGTLFTPAEINSVLYKNWFEEALATYDIQLVAVPVTSSADIPQAAAELVRKDIQLVCQVVDNLTRPGFALIARKAAENGLPVFVFDSDQMRDGGTLCLARDYYDAGLEAAEKAVSILEGKHPSEIPFNNTQSEKLILNQTLANKYGLVLSGEIKDKAIPFKMSN